MRIVAIIVVILAGIAASLGVYFTGGKLETITEETDTLVFYAYNKMTFRVDSIANQQIYLTQLETDNRIILKPQDVFQITHTVYGEPEPKKSSIKELPKQSSGSGGYDTLRVWYGQFPPSTTRVSKKAVVVDRKTAGAPCRAMPGDIVIRESCDTLIYDSLKIHEYRREAEGKR